MSRKLCKPRMPHQCRLCGQLIAIGEPCERWTNLMDGDGWVTSHAHPECYAETDGWDEGDWETCMPGDMPRPAKLEESK